MHHLAVAGKHNGIPKKGPLVKMIHSPGTRTADLPPFLHENMLFSSPGRKTPDANDCALLSDYFIQQQAARRVAVFPIGQLCVDEQHTVFSCVSEAAEEPLG